MLTPNRPGAMESIVVAMRATRAGGRVRIAVEAKSLIFEVTAARPAIRVKDSTVVLLVCLARMAVEVTEP